MTPGTTATSTAENTPTVATPSPTMATPTPIAAGYPEGTRTGEPLVDQVIALVEGRDWAGLAGLVEFTTYPCEAPSSVQPQPLLCRGGLSPGDPMTGFWVSEVEGAFLPPDRLKIANLLETVFSGTKLEAVYAYSPDEQISRVPVLHAAFDIVFVRGSAGGGLSFPNMEVTRTGIVHVDGAFPSMPYVSWNDASAVGWVLGRAD